MQTHACYWRICCTISITHWAWAYFSVFLLQPTEVKTNQQRKRLISPEPKNKISTFSISSTSCCLAIIFLSLFTGKQRLLCGGSGISHCPLLHLDWSHAHYPVYVPLLMYVWERRSISLLCWSPHCARVTELRSERQKNRKERIMMREKHSSGSPVHPHCSSQHSSSALLSCLSSEPHANA